MRTLHTAYRVSHLDRSLDFYRKVGFDELGHVDLPDGRTLVMLMLPDDEVVTLELVLDPVGPPFELGTAVGHIAVQVEDLDSTLNALRQQGIEVEAAQTPGGPDGPKTSFLTDPDGYRIELVQWPPGHANGSTEADFS